MHTEQKLTLNYMYIKQYTIKNKSLRNNDGY